MFLKAHTTIINLFFEPIITLQLIEGLKKLSSFRMDEKPAMEEEKKSHPAMNEQSSLWNKFLLFMLSPADPSNLAVLRIIFGKIVINYLCLVVVAVQLLLFYSETCLKWAPTGSLLVSA